MGELRIGDLIIERYELVRFLGSGSFGEVWLAHDQMTGRDVALKIYLSLDPAGVEEFKREYSNTIDLASPYLLTPEYFDVFHRRPFLVMKYCERGPSSKLAGNISEDQLWVFIEDVSKGLDVLHSQSDPIVHQDIKPDNILVNNSGHFLITDFGISKRLRATMRRQSKRDVSSGAMPYMAPERFESAPKLNTSSDIWSLGASIYELATGELPFSGFGGAMQRNGAEMPSLGEKYSPALNEIMRRCLNANFVERPTAKELAEWSINRSLPPAITGSLTNREPNQRNTVHESSLQNQEVRTFTKTRWVFAIITLILIVGVFFLQNSSLDKGSNEASNSSLVDSVAETVNERLIPDDESFEISKQIDMDFSSFKIGNGNISIPSFLTYRGDSEEGVSMFFDSSEQIRLFVDYSVGDIALFRDWVNRELGSGTVLISRDNCFVQSGYTENNDIYYCKAYRDVKGYMDNPFYPPSIYTAIILYPKSRRDEIDSLLAKMFNPFPNIR